jgi:hypothetical protein
MKTQISIAAVTLTMAASANAAFQATTSFSTWQSSAVGGTAPIVTGDLLYGTGSGASASAGTWGLQFTVASDTLNMSSTASTVTVGNSTGGLQTLTFTFPSAATFAVRGFGFTYTGGAGSPFTIGLAVNGNVLPNQTIQTGTGNFIGVYQDTASDLTVAPNLNPGPSITSITMWVSSGNGFTITGSSFNLVPAPGAVALLGVAGLVGSRRRR